MGKTFSCSCTKETIEEESKSQSSILHQQQQSQLLSEKEEINNKKQFSFSKNNENNDIFPNEILKIINNSNKHNTIASTLSRNNNENYNNENTYTLKASNNKSLENNNIYYTENLENAEKLFTKPLDFSNDYLKYCDNDELKNLIINNQKNKNNNYTDGLILEINGKKCFYKGNIDKNDNLEGYGELYTEDGNKYEGIFNNNILNGLGRYIKNDGTCLEGIFKNNEIISKATILSKDNNDKLLTYFGSIKNLKKNGKGIEYNEDYNYNGDFINNIKEGKGKIIFINFGDIYEGDFHDDKINGKGFYKWKNKETYYGDFINAKMHGHGIYKWPDGSQYEGEYINNIKVGYGIYKWRDGRIFKGNFENGKPHFGKITINGITAECEYKNGKFMKVNDKIFKENEEINN